MTLKFTWRRRLVLPLIGFVACISLSGCDGDLFSGPVAIQMRDGVLRYAVCERVEVSDVSIKERNVGLFRSWDLVASGTGLATISTGDVFSQTEPLPGIEFVKHRDYVLQPGNELSITLRGEVSGDYVDAVFALNDKGIPEGEWLRSDGTIVAAPCL